MYRDYSHIYLNYLKMEVQTMMFSKLTELTFPYLQSFFSLKKNSKIRNTEDSVLSKSYYYKSVLL